MADKIEKPTVGMRPWLRVLLVVSLAFNLLIVGVAVGAAVKWSKWRGDHPARMEMGIGPLSRALSREDRRAIGQDMRKAFRDGRLNRGAHRAELEGLVGDLRAQPYDPAAVEARLVRHGAVIESRMDLGISLLQQRLVEMSSEERAAFADRLEEGLKKHRHGKRGADKGE